MAGRGRGGKFSIIKRKAISAVDLPARSFKGYAIRQSIYII